MEDDDKLNQAVNMEFSVIKEEQEPSHLEEERKNTSSPAPTDDSMDLGGGNPKMYQQSEMIFTQSAGHSYLQIPGGPQVDMRQTFNLRDNARRDKTIVDIVEEKLYERSIIRFQSFKKNSIIKKNQSVKKKPANLYDEELKKLKNDLMQSIVQQHDKTSARSASVESRDRKQILIKDIEEAENLLASIVQPD